MSRPQIPRRWLVAYLLVRAVLVTILGLLLLIQPGETARTLARGLGWILVALGLVDIAAAAVGGSPRPVRWLVLVRGLVTTALGAVLIGLTDATLTVVAILAGMQLAVGGGVSILLGTWAREGEPAVRGVIVRGLFTLVFGAALIAWPDKSVTAIAIALGIQWMISGFLSTAVAVTMASAGRTRISPRCR